jgi:hypothetical protein
MTIIEGNKLIYKFSMPEHWEKVKNCSDSFFISLNYHRDWNQLMPVVEKIGTKIIKYNLTPNNVIFRVEEDDSYDIVIKNNGNLIEAAWKAVAQFIQWYNENKIK